MSTNNDVFIPNVTKGAGAGDMWQGGFALTRAMKKAGWKVLASSDGTTKRVEDAPERDLFGTGTTTGVSGNSHTFAAVSNGRLVVTGLSGIIADHKGMFLRTAGGASAGNNHDHQIEEILSGSSVAIDARRADFTPGADANNGLVGFTWEIFDPTEGGAPTQPFSSAQDAWILMQGPSIIKVPITAAPVAGTWFNFIRGENVVQAVTGAEGEFLGYVFDSGAGYLCIAPRVYGSGADPLGWATTNAITGDTSDATVTQVGAALEYRVQTVMMKDNDYVHGYMAHQCIEPVGETADDFVTLAASVDCTANSAPGQGGGGGANDFPALCHIMNGDENTTTGEDWHGFAAGDNWGNAQVVAVDCIPEAGYTADGDWLWVFANQTDSNGHGGYFFARVLDGEPGDQLYPYITSQMNINVAMSVGNTSARRLTTAYGTAQGDYFSGSHVGQALAATGNLSQFKSWCGRGTGGVGLTKDQFCCITPIIMNPQMEVSTWSSRPLAQHNPTIAMPVITDPATPQAKVANPLWFGHFRSSTNKFIKGRLKRMTAVQGGNRLDVHDNATKIQLSSREGSWVWEPWDGVTVAVPS